MFSSLSLSLSLSPSLPLSLSPSLPRSLSPSLPLSLSPSLSLLSLSLSTHSRSLTHSPPHTHTHTHTHTQIPQTIVMVHTEVAHICSHYWTIYITILIFYKLQLCLEWFGSNKTSLPICHVFDNPRSCFYIIINSYFYCKHLKCVCGSSNNNYAYLSVYNYNIIIIIVLY